MIIELTAPAGTPFMLMMPDDTTIFLQPYRVYITEQDVVDGTQVIVAGMGPALCREAYEDVKSRLIWKAAKADA